MRDSEDKPIGANVPFKKLTASRGKAARAEPVSALYEQGKVHHVGMFPELEGRAVFVGAEQRHALAEPPRLAGVGAD